MKNWLLLLTFTALSSITHAQQQVSLSDFARRPQFYQNKTIVLKNVQVFVSDENNQSGSSLRSTPQRNTNNRSKSEKTISVLTPPRCFAKKGWTLLYPVIPELKTSLCFAVMSRMNDRLPQTGSYQADITVQIDVRGVSEIRKIRVLR